jgi:hypothetical protein
MGFVYALAATRGGAKILEHLSFQRVGNRSMGRFGRLLSALYFWKRDMRTRRDGMVLYRAHFTEISKLLLISEGAAPGHKDP